MHTAGTASPNGAGSRSQPRSVPSGRCRFLGGRCQTDRVPPGWSAGGRFLCMGKVLTFADLKNRLGRSRAKAFCAGVKLHPLLENDSLQVFSAENKSMQMCDIAFQNPASITASFNGRKTAKVRTAHAIVETTGTRRTTVHLTPPCLSSTDVPIE